jgi:hypothetical protein
MSSLIRRGVRRTCGDLWGDAEKPVFAQAAQKGPDARRRHPSDGYPARYEAYFVGTSQRRASAWGHPSEDGSAQMGLFQQPARTLVSPRDRTASGPAPGWEAYL